MQELNKQKKQSTNLYDKIIARLNRLYADAIDEDGNYRYDYYKTQEIKEQAFKEIQTWLLNSYALLFAFLLGVFVYAYNANAKYLMQQAPQDVWGTLDKEIPFLDGVAAKVKYEYEISGLYGQQALANSYSKLLTDVNNVIAKINLLGISQNKATKLMDEAFGRYYRRQKRIYRTEGHRVEELAKYISAQDVLNKGHNVVKVWHNTQDDRVRDTERADHVHLEGQQQALNEPYLLIPTGVTQCPGSSDIADQDINCRCKSEYKII